MTLMTMAILAGGLLLIVAVARFLTKPNEYPEIDLAEIDREELFQVGERLLRESESWSAELTDRSVILASSLEPYIVRAVRYEVEVEADFDAVVAYVRGLSYCPVQRRETDDKIEEMLYEKSTGSTSHEWIRRSVHVSPPPGTNRDAVVVYFEERPDAKTYRVAFRSVDSIDGKAIPPFEGAARFIVNPAIYKAEETAPGKARIIKVEAVDPRGSVGAVLNNYFVSLFFFRRYMFDEAKAMRDALLGEQA
ncbi:MAG: hypothetical protein JRG92_16695 [Deltaproteobacteria bacterium]|nr:hypothetical protein [Deltaproteobacteria bacterium]MBW2696435.1 hypothetical protein [Deltaproteobacteria bacterium]